MITREDIRELADFQFNGDSDCALSFYFQPAKPQNKSHREQSILAKDVVRNALRQAEKNGKNGCARSDLDRMLELVGSWQGKQARAKAVFACGSRKFWREFDLPPQLPGTQLFVNRRFHLKPLAVLLGAHPRLGVAVTDRRKARFFDLRLDELKEREGLFHPLPRRGRGDGFAGYDAGHAQRRVNDEVLHHFKNVAEHLKQAQEKGSFDYFIIGCSDSNWHELDSHLHSYLKKRLLGRFTADVANITSDLVRTQAERIVQDTLDQRRYQVVREALSRAKGNHRGVAGLRRVLRSLEMGEVQTLLLGENYSSRAVECSACGHLDAHIVRYCPLCGRSTRELEDVCEAIIPAAIRRDIELFYVKDDPEFDRVGNIAALLRFRADQSTGGMAIAS
jgi:peptide subunit release factor 1 (eRF1)